MGVTNKGTGKTGRPKEFPDGVRYEQLLSADQYERMSRLAEANYRSFNAEVRRAIDLYLESEKA